MKLYAVRDPGSGQWFAGENEWSSLLKDARFYNTEGPAKAYISTDVNRSPFKAPLELVEFELGEPRSVDLSMHLGKVRARKKKRDEELATIRAERKQQEIRRLKEELQRLKET